MLSLWFFVDLAPICYRAITEWTFFFLDFCGSMIMLLSFTVFGVRKKHYFLGRERVYVSLCLDETFLEALGDHVLAAQMLETNAKGFLVKLEALIEDLKVLVFNSCVVVSSCHNLNKLPPFLRIHHRVQSVFIRLLQELHRFRYVR